jgi:hypothetical protein
MALKTQTLVAISFAMGAGTAVITSELLGHSEGDAGAGLARVETTASNRVIHEQVRSVRIRLPSDNPRLSSPEGAAVDQSDRIANTSSVSECAGADQRDNGEHGRDRQNVFLAEVDALDLALRDEWDASDTTYEREEERFFQEDILAMEEEENLYGLPPSDYEISAEEQDALERDSVSDSVATLATADESFQQQILDNESEIDAAFGDQGETWEDDEH